MKKITNKLIGFLILLAFVSVLASCHKDDPGEEQTENFTKEDISEWIYQWMNIIYLWNDKIPQGLNPANEHDPVSFYNNLLFTEEDKWSYITDDFETYYAELQGSSKSMGYSPAFGLFSGTDKVFIVVEYVIPETPAAEAGLKRGDIILTIDGNELDSTNYYDLYSKESYVAGLGTFDGVAVGDANRSVSLTAEYITLSPVIYSDIIEYQNKKIGYLVYVDFLRGASDMFVTQLDDVLSRFTSNGIDELIVDLRYNPGGQTSMASYLASSIAPVNLSALHKVLASYVYNDYLTDIFLDESGPNSSDFNLFLSPSTFILNMNKVYFMTSTGTASASELVITGLDPYIDVVVVGDTTHGKYTGAWIFPDTEQPPRHNYAIIPIVFKYANSIGITDFKNGLIPDYPIKDKLLGAEPFGSFSDPMLAKTLELITGVNPMPASKKFLEVPSYSKIPDIRKIKRRSIQTDIPDDAEKLFSKKY